MFVVILRWPWHQIFRQTGSFNVQKVEQTESWSLSTMAQLPKHQKQQLYSVFWQKIVLLRIKRLISLALAFLDIQASTASMCTQQSRQMDKNILDMWFFLSCVFSKAIDNDKHGELLCCLEPPVKSDDFTISHWQKMFVIFCSEPQWVGKFPHIMVGVSYMSLSKSKVEIWYNLYTFWQ